MYAMCVFAHVCMCMWYVCVCECVCVCICIEMSMEATGIRFPETGITGDCELLNMGPGNQVCVPWKNNTYP